jgi:hypothetical protein
MIILVTCMDTAVQFWHVQEARRQLRIVCTNHEPVPQQRSYIVGGAAPVDEQEAAHELPHLHAGRRGVARLVDQRLVLLRQLSRQLHRFCLVVPGQLALLQVGAHPVQ